MSASIIASMDMGAGTTTYLPATGTATVLVTDNDTPELQVTTTTPTITEGETAHFVITAPALQVAELEVRIAVQDSTGEFLTGLRLPTYATISAASSTATVSITTVRNPTGMTDGTISLSLPAVGQGPGYRLGQPSAATVNVLDDSAPTLSVADVTAERSGRATGVHPAAAG